MSKNPNPYYRMSHDHNMYGVSHTTIDNMPISDMDKKRVKNGWVYDDAFNIVDPRKPWTHSGYYKPTKSIMEEYNIPKGFWDNGYVPQTKIGRNLHIPDGSEDWVVANIHTEELNKKGSVENLKGELWELIRGARFGENTYFISNFGRLRKAIASEFGIHIPDSELDEICNLNIDHNNLTFANITYYDESDTHVREMIYPMVEVMKAFGGLSYYTSETRFYKFDPDPRNNTVSNIRAINPGYINHPVVKSCLSIDGEDINSMTFHRLLVNRNGNFTSKFYG